MAQDGKLEFSFKKIWDMVWQEVIPLGWCGISKTTEAGTCQSHEGRGGIF